jgi:3-methyladenine DNA glycosylase AlkD
MPDTAPLIDALRAAFAAHADATQAGPMQAYMKSAMPFRGIAAPLRRRLMVEVVREHPARSTEDLATTMLALWRGAAFREERYAASELAGAVPHRRLRGLALLPVYEEMIVTGAWWDHCDEISANGLAPLLVAHPGVMKPQLRAWAAAGDLWVRRAAMLTQRRLKGDAFDAVLLYDTILSNLRGSRFGDEFFIRKGLGWALRERSYAAPDEVQAFCSEYSDRLSPLSRREALKAIARRAAH